MIDTHVHLWDPGVLRYPWLEALPQLNRAFRREDFAAASAGAGLTGFIFVESGGEPARSREEVVWVSAIAKEEPRLRGIVAQASVELGEALRPEVAALAGNPLVKGVRRLLQGESQADFCLRPEFVAGVRLLEAHQFTFDLCLRWEQLAAVAELVRRVPEVQFVLDHCGKPPVRDGSIQPWARELTSLARLPNVSCKVSGLATEADWKTWQPKQLQPYWEVAREAFGPERLLFGGDWPVCTLATEYQRWLETVAHWAAAGTAADRKKLFQSNAERIYRI